MDVDRGEEITIALGDREVKAQVARDEVLELVADSSYQRCVGAEVRCSVIGGVRRRAPTIAPTSRRPLRDFAPVQHGAPRHLVRQIAARR